MSGGQYRRFLFAPVMELVDMRDLGSRAFSVWVRVPSGAPKPPRRLLLYGRRGGFFFVMHPPADRARSPLSAALRRARARRASGRNSSVFLFHAAGVPFELPDAQKRRQCKLIERIGVVVSQALLRAQRGDQLPRRHDVAQPHGRKEHLAERPDGEHTLRCKLEERGRRWSFIVELALKIVLQEIRRCVWRTRPAPCGASWA